MAILLTLCILAFWQRDSFFVPISLPYIFSYQPGEQKKTKKHCQYKINPYICSRLNNIVLIY
ncbi:hypothetical protein M2480_002593 [Parabacteroides sp. PFB2-12]|nr:hypothetical protein [Parabacteroides sp. PM6-13]MDH6391595.1 hypothetical protein [Parabacteroides sp. PFB2-12]